MGFPVFAALAAAVPRMPHIKSLHLTRCAYNDTAGPGMAGLLVALGVTPPQWRHMLRFLRVELECTNPAAPLLAVMAFAEGAAAQGGGAAGGQAGGQHAQHPAPEAAAEAQHVQLEDGSGVAGEN